MPCEALFTRHRETGTTKKSFAQHRIIQKGSIGHTDWPSVQGQSQGLLPDPGLVPSARQSSPQSSPEPQSAFIAAAKGPMASSTSLKDGCQINNHQCHIQVVRGRGNEIVRQLCASKDSMETSDCPVSS